jgi:tight adherence protein C
VEPGILLALGLAAIFVSLVLVFGTIGAFDSERQQVGRSLASIQQLRAMPDDLRRDADVPFADRVLRPAMGRLTRFGRRIAPSGQTERIELRLAQAGNPAGWDADRIIAFKVLGLLGGAVLGLVLAVLFGRALAGTVLLTVAIALVGFYGPNIALNNQAQRRRDAMRKALPDSLDLLTISVEAGLAFDAALAQVARNTEGPLADEFARVLQEMQIGTGRMDALRALGERSPLPELRGFVTAMVQADAFGIPIANVLRVQAAEMRVKRRQAAEEKAQKVPVKILFPLIVCILPALFGVILGPAALTIMDTLGN